METTSFRNKSHDDGCSMARLFHNALVVMHGIHSARPAFSPSDCHFSEVRRNGGDGVLPRDAYFNQAPVQRIRTLGSPRSCTHRRESAGHWIIGPPACWRRRGRRIKIQRSVVRPYCLVIALPRWFGTATHVSVPCADRDGCAGPAQGTQAQGRCYRGE